MDTNRALSKYILEQVKNNHLDKKTAAAFLKEITRQEHKTTADMAVIGIACRFSEADNKEEFWHNIVTGTNNIRPFPSHRIEDWSGADEAEYTHIRNGFLEEIDKFDEQYFTIPPHEAMLMDPYQRLMLEVLTESFADAGYAKNAFYGKNVGIYIGNDHTHKLFTAYADIFDNPDFQSVLGSWTGVLASRLSYILNLRGPALVIDSACSSSLVALDAACKAIQAGDCELAAVGGINILLDPHSSTILDIETTEPRVKAFDKDAAGTLWGEGVASILIKPLAKARADRDHIYGVIKGTAVNNDGTSNGITAPNARAQTSVILKAWERAGINPEHLSYIETHGTGTNLGDPIEIKGLTAAFEKFTKKKQFCAVSSVKTNIGHTVGVAGLASLIKVLMGLKKDIMPPGINFTHPNPLIDFCNSPVYVNDRACAWKKESGPRTAGVSSFSISGTNCHVVVEEAPDHPEIDHAIPGTQIFTLSARNKHLLLETIERYLKYTTDNPDNPAGNICFTANTGREHYPYRLAMVIENTYDLQNKLIAFSKRAAGDVSPEDIGDLESSAIYIAGCIGNDDHQNGDTVTIDKQSRELFSRITGETQPTPDILRELAGLYAKGATINWNTLYEAPGYHRLDLPPEPFIKKRHWPARELIHQAVAGRSSMEGAGPAVTETSVREADASPVEKELAAIWGGVLGYETISIHDNFYALGADSISALKIVNEIHARFNNTVTVTAFLNHPTIAEFARYLETDYTGETVTEDGYHNAPITPVAPQDYYPVSSAQKRMYMLWKMVPTLTLYNVTVSVILHEKPDHGHLNDIFTTLIKRHENLRTSFKMRDNEPVQIIHEEFDFAVEYQTLETPVQDNERLHALVKECIKPFDFAKAPLIRVYCIILNDDKSLLVIDMPHIVTDGTSMGILFNELAALHNGAPLEPLTVQYKDFTAWQNALLRDTAANKLKTYWLERFNDEIPVLELSLDYTRPAVLDYEGRSLFFELDGDIKEKITQLGVSTNTTLFMILIAAYYILLSKYSGSEDIVVGVPVNGRSHIDTHSLIGMFVNTLPLRCRPNGTRSFSDFLQEVKTAALGAFEHQDYQLEALIEALDIRRDPGRNPLFDVSFALQNEDMGLDDANTETMELHQFDTGRAKFDLTLEVREEGPVIQCKLEYCTKLFNHEKIELMAAHYKNILESIAAAPDTPLSDIEYLGDAEKKQLIYGFNRTKAAYPRHLTLQEQLEAQVLKTPDKTALMYDDHSLTYHELNKRANQIAAVIRERGIAPDTPVGLLVERSTDMVCALHGIIKAGGAYVPINHEYPAERITYILDDSKTPYLITTHAALEQHSPADIETFRTSTCPDTGTPLCREIVFLDEIDKDADDPGNPGNINTADDLCYIIYTSGSSGKPKGTLISHYNVTSLIENTNYFQFSEKDRFLTLTSYTFDFSIMDFFGCLLHGGTVILANNDDIRDINKIARLIREKDITVFAMTTALFNVLIDTNLPSLKNIDKVFFGGEQISFPHAKKALAYLGPDRLLHMYGPTECTVIVSYHSMQQIDETLGTVPIGKPICNTSLYILDKYRRPVPIGVDGELCIGGDGLARGYLGNPDLTGKTFVNNPNVPGEIIYTTGDQAKFLPDGNIVFTGRLDSQVKIRGFRVELGEIKTIILDHEHIRDAHVVILKDENNDKQLCAYYVVKEGTTCSPEELNAFISGKLPAYMIPNHIMQLDAFPRNTNEKIDTQRLPKPCSGSRDYVSPVTGTEKELAAVFEQILGIDKVGITDNFFQLGGDSIRAIRISAGLAERGLHLETAWLYQFQTIKEISPHVTKLHVEESTQSENDYDYSADDLNENELDDIFADLEIE